MNRRDLVLAVLAAADGSAYTPVQIQKAIFIICDHFPKLINEGAAFNFQPYDYGPFDSDVYSEISALQREGEATITPSSVGNWNTYAASHAGTLRGKELLLRKIGEKERHYILKISGWVRSLSFRTLVKSIYDAYPEMMAKSIFRG